METTLKERLLSISQNNCRIPDGSDLFSLALEMMGQIGSVDSELRDDLIYSAFCQWIYKERLFTDEQLKLLLWTALDQNHISYRLGEENTNSVFTRSFSVLLLPLLLIRHRESPYLSVEQIHLIKLQLLKYLKEERDVRGYVEGKGWAHSAAHTADALDDLAQCKEMDAKDLLEILYAIGGKMNYEPAQYGFEEDERMVTAVVSILERQLLTDDEIIKWINVLVEAAKEKKPLASNFGPRNIKQFLRSLYFRIHSEEKYTKILTTLVSGLDEMNRFRR